jgi:hypothetical protein
MAKSKRLNRRRGPSGWGTTIKPPSLTTAVKSQHTFRYVLNSGVADDFVESADLLNSLVMATSSTNAYRLIAGFRIKRISMWAWAESATPVSLNMQWTGEYGPAVVVSDTSAGATCPAHITTVPPKLSGASFWRISGVDESTKLFTLDAPTGTIIDVECEIFLQDDVTGGFTPVVYTGSSLTAGLVYSGRLDKSNSSVIAAIGFPDAA